MTSGSKITKEEYQQAVEVHHQLVLKQFDEGDDSLTPEELTQLEHAREVFEAWEDEHVSLEPLVKEVEGLSGVAGVVQTMVGILEEAISEGEACWREDAPPATAMLISGDYLGINVVADYIGEVTEYMEQTEPIGRWFRGFELKPGIWRVEFELEVHHEFGEREEIVRLLSVRPATEKEVQSMANQAPPWDVLDWLVEGKEGPW